MLTDTGEKARGGLTAGQVCAVFLAVLVVLLAMTTGAASQWSGQPAHRAVWRRFLRRRTGHDHAAALRAGLPGPLSSVPWAAGGRELDLPGVGDWQNGRQKQRSQSAAGRLEQAVQRDYIFESRVRFRKWKQRGHGKGR